MADNLINNDEFLFSPTILIGVGGTGSKVLAHLDKKLREDDLNKKYEQLFKIIALDTDVGELGDLKIEKTYKVELYSGNGNAYDLIQQLNFPSWFPEKSKIPEAYKSFNLKTGAGQFRIFSRLGFEVNIERIKNVFKAAISDLSTGKQGSHNNPTRFNVCIVASICGGTGSGSFLQTAKLIRDILTAEGKEATIKVYLFTPDIYQNVIKQSAQQKNIKENAYACLKDIDAFLKVQMTTGTERSYLVPSREHLEINFKNSPSNSNLVNKDIIDYVFLIDATNKNGIVLESTLGAIEYEYMLSNSLYCSIFSPINQKQESTESNLLSLSIDAANNNSSPIKYGGVGSNKFEFPYKYLANYFSHVYLKDIFSREWKEVDEIFRTLMGEYEKEKERGQSGLKKPLRHLEYINFIDSEGAKSDDAQDKYLLAFRKYKDNYQKFNGRLWIKQLLTQVFTTIINTIDVKIPEYIELFTQNEVNDQVDRLVNGEAVSFKMHNSLGLSTANLLQAIASSEDQNNEFQTILTQISKWDNVSKTFQNESRDFPGKTNFIQNSIFKDFNDVRHNIEKISISSLAYWLTPAGEEKINIFYYRYFLSKELVELENIDKNLTHLLSNLKYEIDQFKTMYDIDGTTKIETASDTLITFKKEGFFNYIKSLGFGSPVKNFVSGKGLEGTKGELAVNYQNYLNCELNNYIIETFQNVLKEIRKYLSYKEYEIGDKITGSDLGILESIHQLTDYFVLSEKRYQRESDPDNEDSLSKRNTIQYVYYNRNAKEELKAEILQSNEGEGQTKEKEITTKLIEKLENNWRSLICYHKDPKTSNKDEIKFTIQKFRNTLNNEIINEIKLPIEKKYQEVLYKKIDILEALRRDTILRLKSANKFDYSDTDILIKTQEEVERRFNQASPFVNFQPKDKEIYFYAINKEINESEFFKKVIEAIKARYGSLYHVPINSRNEMIFYNTTIGYELKDYRNLYNYYQEYKYTKRDLHIDINWRYTLPEVIESENEFFVVALIILEFYKLLKMDTVYSGKYYLNINYKYPDREPMYEKKSLTENFWSAYVEIKRLYNQKDEIRNFIDLEFKKLNNDIKNNNQDNELLNFWKAKNLSKLWDERRMNEKNENMYPILEYIRTIIYDLEKKIIKE